ncbi:MAG: FAD-dependent oxidoreductase [Deltaproteobacteria bacterium]|nr:FAD-dependent oxidoreductase [Deltaproteobacteria bacterium]
MSQRVVIIGAVALGPKTACRLKRLEPDSRVTMVDQDDLISYGGCGIPYFISGDVSDPAQLQSTSFNMLRDEAFFREAKDIEVLTGTRALTIDRESKRVHVESVKTGEKGALPYDRLVLATGSRPRPLSILNSDLKGVFTVSNMDDAMAVKKMISEGAVGKAVMLGAGFIGLEVAEALSDLWGIETSVVEIMDQVLPGITSKTLAGMVQKGMELEGIRFHLGEKALRLEGKAQVEKVITDKRELEADLVVLAAGVIPNSDLAKEAGLDVSSTGAIIVNNRMETSDPDIYAGGDCVQITNLITGKPGYYPMGSMANRQGRVIGTNLAGGDARFEGAVGSFVVKLFDHSVAGAGLGIETALQQGFDAISAFVVQFDRAHFYPEKDLMSLELVVEKGSGRVLGIQGLGNSGDGMKGRIDAVAAILPFKPTTKDISNLELAYSPPFSSAMDILNALGNTAENILHGKNRIIDAPAFEDLWHTREKGDTCFLDCRGRKNAEPYINRYPREWKSIPQDELRARLDEVPGDKNIVLICNTGVRSYEAQITLDQAGIRTSFNLQGGMAAVKKWGLDL